MTSNHPPKQGPIVAIDGPAGTGKSSTTRRLAQELGFVHVDTGALYRAIGYKAIASGWIPTHLDRGEIQLSPEIEAKIVAMAADADLEFRKVSLDSSEIVRLFFDKQDITDHIRTPAVSVAASVVSAIGGVRGALFEIQRKLGSAGNTILEGRDIGTIIFPDADIKFFLTASIEERAKRRLAELQIATPGKKAPSLEIVKAQIESRDLADSTRAIAPLVRAPDAIEIDTSGCSLDEVVEAMKAHIRKRVGIG